MRSLRVLLFVAIAAAAAPVLACSCIDFTLDEAVAKADAVLVGKVIKLEVVREWEGINVIAATVQVLASKKGELPGVVTFETTDGCCYCAFQFEIGHRYLLLAKKNKGVFYADACLRSTEVRDARDDLAALGLSQFQQ